MPYTFWILVGLFLFFDPQATVKAALANPHLDVLVVFVELLESPREDPADAALLAATASLTISSTKPPARRRAPRASVAKDLTGQITRLPGLGVVGGYSTVYRGEWRRASSLSVIQVPPNSVLRV